MRIALHKIFNPKVIHNLRSLYTSQIARDGAYDGPGKTTVSILNRNDSELMIDSYGPGGFLLNNGLRMVGPLIIFPRSVLFWNVVTAEDINKDSLILFDILEPKIDLLIIGLEKSYDFIFVKTLKEQLKNLDIKNEVFTVDKACSVFNFMSSEGRYAAAALIPPTSASIKELIPYRHLLKKGKEDNNLIDST